MTRLLLLFVTCLAVAAVSARPQFTLTPRELEAFETVLGDSHPVSISSAIPVMAFSDQKPSKFVSLPQGKRNGLGIKRSGGSPIPAEKIHFEESFGRSATNGPVLNAGVETVSHGVLGRSSLGAISTFDDDSFTLTSGSTLDSLQTETTQSFPDLNFGFKPVSSAISSSVQSKSPFSSSHVVRTSFSPSPQITHGGTFRPSIFAGFGDATIHDDSLTGISTLGGGLSHGLGFLGGFGSSGLSSKSPIDVKEVSVTGKNLNEDDNLYRHHVGASLIPTHGAGPATIAAGKLLASKGSKVGNTIGRAIGHALDETTRGELVTRSLADEKKSTSSNTVNLKNSNDKKADISVNNGDSQAVVGASIAVDDPKARIRGTVESVPIGIRPESGSKAGRSAASRGQQTQFRKSQQSPGSPNTGSSNSGVKSLFNSGSLQIPNIPNIQLPLQTASASPSSSVKSASPEPKSASDITLDTEKFLTSEDKPALLTVHNFRPPQKNQAPGLSSSSDKGNEARLTGSTRSEQLLKLLRERAIVQNAEETSTKQTLPPNSAKSTTPSQVTPKPQPQSTNAVKNNFPTQLPQEPQTITPKTTKPSFSIPGSVPSEAKPSSTQQKTQSSISLQNKQIADTLAKLTASGVKPIIISNGSPNGASTPFSVAQIHQLLKSSQVSNLATSLQQQQQQQQQQAAPLTSSGAAVIKSTPAGTTVVRATPGQANAAIQSSAVKSVSGTGSLGALGGLGGLGGLNGLGSLGGLGGLGALGGGSAAGGQPTIIVKTLELDAKDADPSSAAFKAALAKATKEAREELGVSSSEELGVGGANLASLFGKRRRKRQLFGGESSSNAQSFGNALSTGAGIFEQDTDDEDNSAHEE